MTEADRLTAAAAATVAPEEAAVSAAPAEGSPSSTAAYCRRCGYALRGLPAAGRCPECGGPFDLSDRKTFARRPPRPRLRWWAWRVSIALVLLTAAAACVPGWYWWQWRNEQRALDTLRQLGARVVTVHVEPDWPGRWLPGRWAYLHDRADEVWLHDRTADEIARVDFTALAHLERLQLAKCQVTDAALARLGGLAELRLLELPDNPLDGSGLMNLSACRQLERLGLHGTQLNDAGLAGLAGRFPALALLDLDYTRVTDAGLAALDGRAALKTLYLSRTAVTPAGLRRLVGLTGLRVVEVRGMPMTDQEARDLRARMPNVFWHR